MSLAHSAYDLKIKRFHASKLSLLRRKGLGLGLNDHAIENCGAFFSNYDNISTFSVSFLKNFERKHEPYTLFPIENLKIPNAMDSLQPLPDENRGPSESALIVVLTAVSTVIVILRLYSRLFVLRTMGWDDGMMVVAVVFSVLFEVVNLVGINTYGYGRHQRFLNRYQIMQNYKLCFISSILYCLTVFFVKVSLLLFLLRINKLKRWVQKVIYLTLFLVFASQAAAIIVRLVQCKPIAGNWDPAVGAHCLSERTLILLYYLSSGFPAMTDFVCAILPFFMLWDVKISKKTKVSIWVLLCFGMFPGVCSVITISYCNMGPIEDYTWSTVPYLTWSVAEIHSGIIAASIPTLRALALSVITRLRGDPKLPNLSYKSRNRYRCRVRDQYECEDGASVSPLHKISDQGNQGGIFKTIELGATNTTKPGTEGILENTSDGDAQFVSSTPEEN